MGISLFGSYLVAFFTIIFAMMSNTDLEINSNRDVSAAIKIAAQAAATKWDKEATAEAGMIILDVDDAASAAVDFFSDNTQNDVNIGQLQVEVVNEAPTTRFINGEEFNFNANGVILSYGKFVEVAEADDRT